MPQRVQIRRDKPWRTHHPTAIKVDRSTKWGNPHRVINGDRATAVTQFREHIANNPDLAAQAERELAGKDLACWCPPHEPCHADVLLQVANNTNPNEHR